MSAINSQGNERQQSLEDGALLQLRNISNQYKCTKGAGFFTLIYKLSSLDWRVRSILRHNRLYIHRLRSGYILPLVGFDDFQD